MIKINLIPTAKKKPPVAKPKVPKVKLEGIKIPWGWIIVGAVLIGISLVAMYVINMRFDQQAEQLKMEIADLKRKVAAFKVDIRKIEEAKRVKGELLQKIEIIRSLKESQRGPVRMMSSLSDAMPEGVWLTDLKPEGEAIYNMSGFAVSTKALVDFIYNLSATPYFHSIELLGLSQTTAPNYPFPLQQFSLRANVRYRKGEE